MLFERAFLKLLDESLLDSLPKLKPYQRLGSRGLDRKKLHQVPNYARGRGDLNSKIESLRTGQSSKAILIPSDVAYLKKRYNIQSIDDGKELGTTGIKCSVCPVTGQYMLTR